MFTTINIKKLLTSLALTLGVGLLSGWIATDAQMIYENVIKPPLAPPSQIFGVVWIILYIIMGLSFYLIRTDLCKDEKSKAYRYFTVQLIFNFFWPILFFNLGQTGIAIIWIFLLIIFIGITIWEFKKINKAASILLIPYLAWCLYALYLNAGIWALG